MRARVVVASVAVHAAIVIALLAIGAAGIRPLTVDVEIVAPVFVTAERAAVPPPILERGHGGLAADRRADRTPAPRGEPARRLPRAHRPAPPTPSPVAAAPAAPARAEIDPEPAAGEAAEPGAEAPGDASGGGERGSGDGGGGSAGGSGDGAGRGAVDLSARPVPIDPNPAQVLPYTAEAQRDRISGDVRLELLVDPLGHVGRVTVRRGLGHGLDEIATRLAMQIRFHPARDRAGKPTTGTVRWGFHFEPP